MAQQPSTLDQAFLLLPGYENKVWPDSDDEFFIEKLDSIKCDIQFAKELLVKLVAEQEGQPVIHGVNCEKVEHAGHWMYHDNEDDSHYYYDQIKYCGRCHEKL